MGRSARAVLDLLMSEEELVALVVDGVHILHGKVAHFRPAETRKGWRTPVQGDKGFPDLVLAIPPTLYIWEAKAQRGRLSPEQLEWAEILGRCTTLESGLIRPADWDTIWATLQKEANNA